MRRGAGTGGRRKQKPPRQLRLRPRVGVRRVHLLPLRRHRRPGGQCPMRRAVCGVRRIWNMPDYEKSVPAQVAAMDVLPGLVVPYHYGVDAPSTKENGARLCAALTAAGIPCRGMEKGAVLTLWRNAAFHPSCPRPL